MLKRKASCTFKGKKPLEVQERIHSLSSAVSIVERTGSGLDCGHYPKGDDIKSGLQLLFTLLFQDRFTRFLPARLILA